MPTFVPPYKRKPGWRNGRRAGFRYQWSNIRIGSTPISGTQKSTESPLLNCMGLFYFIHILAYGRKIFTRFLDGKCRRTV